MAKLLLWEDFRGYLLGYKVVGDWSGLYTAGERVTAEDLFAAYHRNEVAADERFRHKRIVVTGVVTSISKDAFDAVYLLLADQNEFESVHANLSTDSAKVAENISRGNELALFCTGGEMILGSPMLNDCQTADVVFAQKRSSIESWAETFLAGADDNIPTQAKMIIGMGYAVGISLPAGNPCEKSAPEDMGACLKQMKSVPRDKTEAAYKSLGIHLALPPRPAISSR